MSFKEDLEKWEKMEKIVIEKFKDTFPWLHKNKNKKWVDLIYIAWIEVKFDEYIIHSWNVFIEVASNWQPSWIFKKEDYKVEYWAHSDGNNIYFYNKHKLEKYVFDKIIECRRNKSLTSCWHRYILSAWDWWRTSWLLIPLTIFAENADEIINL